MQKPDETAEANALLRMNAEAQLARSRGNAAACTDLPLHELQVHQIELEMQNETLRQSQVALEESRDRYIDFYDFAPVGYLTLTDKGLITEINLSGAEMLGMAREKLLARRFSPFVAEHDVDRWHRHYLRALQHDAKLNCEIALRRADGTGMDVRVDSLRYKKDGHTPVLRLVLTDITARKQAESELQRFFTLIPDLLCIAASDGRFLKVNPAWTTILGYSEAELLAIPFLDLIHPDDRDSTTKEVARQMAGASTLSFCNRYRCKDGNYKWLEWNASRAADQSLLLASARDVSESRRNQLSLRDALHFQETILNAAPYAIIAGTPDGIITHFSRGAEHMLGYAAEEIIGKCSIAMLHDPQELPLRTRNSDTQPAEQPHRPFSILLDTAWLSDSTENEWPLMRKDGSRFPALVSSVALSAENGSISGFLSVSLDISERKHSEQLRIERERQHRGVLMREVHHRIKNHLQGLAGLVRQNASKHPALESVAGDMIAQIAAIATVHGLQGRNHGRSIYLREVIADIVTFLCRSGRVIFTDKSLHSACEWTLNEEDAVPIALIINELITNAQHHGRSALGEPVRVELECKTGDSQVIIRNPGTLPPGFDFAANKGLGTGLELVRSLLPPWGATLDIGAIPDDVIESRLVLTSPVVVVQSERANQAWNKA